MSKSARHFKTQGRERRARKEKPMLLFTAEGTNVTERQYFESFRSQQCPYIIKYHKAGNVTDPKKLAAAIRGQWEREDADAKSGDRAFVIVDLDNNHGKALAIRRLIEEHGVEEYIVSNPCFEVWYLFHGDYSSKGFLDSNAVVKELRRAYPDYEKTTDMSTTLRDKTKQAIHNAKRLEKHFEQLEYAWPSEQCNPRTDVYKMVELLVPKDD